MGDGLIAVGCGHNQLRSVICRETKRAIVTYDRLELYKPARKRIDRYGVPVAGRRQRGQTEIQQREYSPGLSVIDGYCFCQTPVRTQF